MKECKNCGRHKNFAGERCTTCYRYLRLYGVERPVNAASLAAARRAAEAPKKCECGNPAIYSLTQFDLCAQCAKELLDEFPKNNGHPEMDAIVTELESIYVGENHGNKRRVYQQPGKGGKKPKLQASG